MAAKGKEGEKINKKTKKTKNKKTKNKKTKQQKAKGRGNDPVLKILYANAQGLQGKQGSLQSAAETAEATIIAITETAGKPPT